MAGLSEPAPGAGGVQVGVVSRGVEPAVWLGRLAGIGLALGALLCFVGSVALSALLMPARFGPLVPSAVVEVPAGASAAQVGRMLQERGLVRSGAAFAVLARVTGADRGLQAGSYRMRSDMSLFEVLTRIRQGAVETVRVTIPEGATIRSIAGLLEGRGLARAEVLVELASDDQWLFGAGRPFDKPPGSLEGYLFPDTYLFALGEPEPSILRKMVARFAERMLPIYQRLGTGSGLSLHEAVVLASIIEKEAVVDRERPLISSVFHNRLRRGRPLQSDPTLMYVLEPRPRRLLRGHLSINSPYNTYRYRGLPPTAIASPGEASFVAALRPAATDYLYFVARGDGTHVFSRTFQEHVQARQLPRF